VSEPRWLDHDIVIDVHAEQLALFGGAEGIRDRGLLESALSRPINKFHYGENDIAALAAAYAFGIARNHPFVDGNKRAAFASIMILGLAAGEIGEEGLARWIRENLPRSK
jgi:death-on-curing protein